MFKNKKGFTLMEIVVVVAIIAVFVGAAAFALSHYGEDAKRARVKSDMETLTTAVQKYYADTGTWPAQTTITQTDVGLCDLLMNEQEVSDPDGGKVKKGPWLAQCPHSPYESNGGSYSITMGTKNFNITETKTEMQLKELR